MDQSAVVGVLQPLGNLPHQLGDLLERQPGPLRVGSEIDTVDPFRNDVARPRPSPASVVNWHDVGMVEAGENPCLGQVRVDIMGCAQATGAGFLERHWPMQFEIVRQPDGAERPLAQLTDLTISLGRGARLSIIAPMSRRRLEDRAGLHDASIDRPRWIKSVPKDFDLLSICGKPGEIFVALGMLPLPLTVLYFDLQQFRQQSRALVRGDPLEK